MTPMKRLAVLLLLPLLSFCAGTISARVATTAVKLAAPEPLTLLDAVASGQDEAMLRMISKGADPGLPGSLKRPVLHWRRGDTTSPLLIAIGGGDLNKVAYMMKYTRRIADPPNDQGLCVAARYGHTNLAQLLMKMKVPAVPKFGCGKLKRPEDVAEKFGSRGLAKALRSYRLKRQASLD